MMRVALLVALSGAITIASANGQCTPVWAVDVPTTSPTSPLDFIDRANAAVVFDPDGPGGQAERIFVASSSSLSTGVVHEWTSAGWSPIGNNLGFSIASLAVWDEDGEGPHPPELVAGNNGFSGLMTWDGSEWRQRYGGVGGPVRSMIAFDDGANPGRPSLFIAGSVVSASGLRVNNIARWDGTCWSDLAGGANSAVNALAVFDADGDGPGVPALYAAGSFTSIGGEAANRFAKWDGTAWSAVGSGFNSQVITLAVFDLDGAGPTPPRLYAGGDFATAGGVLARGVAVFDGSMWSGFGTALSRVSCLAAHDPDANGPEPASLYAGGMFRAGSSSEPNYVAKWSGTDWARVGSPPIKDAAFLLPVDFDGPGPAEPVLLVGGSPSTETPEIPNAIVGVWDGSGWSSPPRGINGEILAMTSFDADGPGPEPARLLLGGAFTHGDGHRLGGIAEDVEGALLPVGSGTDGTVRAIAAWDADGTGPGNPAIVAGGLFTQAGGSAASNIARWDGAAWSPLGSGLNNIAESVAAADLAGSGHPRLYAGGVFDHAGPLAVGRIAVWDGAAWSALGMGVSGSSPSVLAIAAFDDGSPAGLALYAAGRFTQAGADPALNIARWDGAAWSPVGPGLNGPVRALLVHDEDGSGPRPPALFAAGEFAAAGSLAVPGIARWNGTEWSAVGVLVASPAGIAPMVHRMTAHDEDGSGPAPATLWITSTLAIPGGVGGVLRWDGSTWTDRPAPVVGITPTPIASVLTPGSSTLYTTRPPEGLRRATPVLRLTDPTPPAILAHSPPVRRIHVGSFFSEGVAITVDPTISVGYRWYHDGVLVTFGPLYTSVGGPTLRFQGRAVPEHAGEYHAVIVAGGCELLTGPSTIIEVLCRADLNEDGYSDFTDLLDFFDLFDSGDCRADLDGDGAVDAEDYETMLDWLAGPC